MPTVIDFEPDQTTIDFTPDIDFEPDPPTVTATTPPGPSIDELRSGGVLEQLPASPPPEPRAINQIPLRDTIGVEPQPALTYQTNPEQRREEFTRAATAPIVPIPKFTVNPDDSVPTAVGKSIVNFATGILEFAESPAGILTAPVAGIAPKTVASLFTLDMAKSLGDQATASGLDWENLTDAQKAAAVTDMSATGLMATALGAGVGVKLAREVKMGYETAQKFADTKSPINPDFDVNAFNELNRLAPQTAKAVAETPSVNASREPLAAEASTPLVGDRTPSPPSVEVVATKPSEFSPEQATRQAEAIKLQSKTSETPPPPPTAIATPGAPLEAKAKSESQSELQKQLQDELYGTSEWASATESIKLLTPESGPVGKAPEFSKIEPQELGAGVSLPQFKVRKMTPLDVATAQHSAKMQRSESNARRAVKDIRKLAKNEDRQSAIAIWVEAAGDVPTLQGWATAARGEKFRKAATAAQNLTPEEISLGRKVISAFQSLYTKGVANDVVTSFRDNYITHIWETPKKTLGLGGSGTLEQNFKFNKARTFATFFEGDQAGFIPKTLALDRIVPAYIKEMDSVIAARQFVKAMAGQLASDGRPLVIPRGTAKTVTGASGDATLIFPESLKNVKDATGEKVDQRDYRTMENQPALQKWSWVAEDQAGNPVMLQADLSLHPEAIKRINSMLGTSAIKAWYSEPSSGTAQIPRAIVKGLDAAQSEMKRSMFGLLAPFHQVQEGTHAIGHTVNPFFGIPKVDLKNPAQLDAAAHGLMMLPDKASSASYLEGSGSQSSLIVKGIKKVPGLRAIGEASDLYQDYLFHQYIPGLKFKTYEHILERNTKRFAPEMASGEVTLKDVKLLSAEQSNAAYGHLNYALLDRNPTIQHFLRLAALAPDFLEARSRFAGQAVKGLSSKVGHEQLRAIAFLAAVQAGTALVASQLLGVPYDPHHPFELVYEGRRYAMRSVPEDIFALVKDTRSFAYSRINPLITKGGIQYLTGQNYRGEKVTAGETTAELLAGYIPITARSIPGLRDLTFTSRNQPVSPIEQLSGSIGLRISRYSPISETYKLAREWEEKNDLPVDRGSYPVSKYQQLRYSLEDNDTDGAVTAYQELLKTMPAAKISLGFRESISHPFTGSAANDKKFSESLTGYDLELYNLAVRRRKDILNRFRLMPKNLPVK